MRATSAPASAATSRRSVVHTLIVGLGGIVVLLLLLALGLLWALRDTSRREARIRDDYYPRLIQAQQLRAAMVDQETGVRGYIITGDESFLAPFTAGRAAYERARDALRARPPLSPALGDDRARQFDLAEAWYTQVALPQIGARRAGAQLPDEQLAALEQGKQLFDSFRAANDAYAAQVQGAIDDAADDVRARRRATFVAGGLGALVALAAAVIVSVWLVRLIRRPLEELGAVVAAVEAGDTARRAPPLADAEFQRLGHGVNVMLDSLSGAARATELERQRLATIVESATDGIIVVDVAGAIRVCNPAAAAMFGLPAADLVGRAAATVPFLEHGADALRQAESGARPEPVVRKQGERVLSAVVSPLAAPNPAADGGDGAYGAVWIIRDVTELARIDEMKNEFVSIVSHELRTPLTAIKGFTDLILEGDVGEVTPEQREFLEIVQSNSDRLVALINDMLDISRIEAGRIALHVEPLDLRQAVERAATSFRPLLDERRQTLQTELDQESPLVLADEARLQQILANLLSNACKYTPPGGWITVRSSAVGGQVAVSVSDTGVGIPAEALPRLFSKFYRVDQATTAEIGGTGLGLAITKALVELHGGRITVASRSGAGTTVRFTLPTDGGEHDGAALSAAGFAADEPWHGARVGHARVLMAEDDPEAALLTQRLLSARGLEVTVVPDGLAALVRAMEWLPDAIVLDVNMPKMGAAEVLPKLRGNPGTRDIPVIIVTGTVPDARSVFIEAGAADFFTKPLNIDALAARLAQLTRKTATTSMDGGNL